MTKSIFVIVGAIFGAACLFFVYYTARLTYVNIMMTADEAAAHRTGGMLIGAIAFPLVAMSFGLISLVCFRKALKGKAL
jgi:hypothetical protein